MSCTSQYKLMEVRFLDDGRETELPKVLAEKFAREGRVEILQEGGVSTMPEKEIVVKKKDGSIHQLPESYATELVKNKEAELVKPKKKKKSSSKKTEGEKPKKKEAKTKKEK